MTEAQALRLIARGDRDAYLRLEPAVWKRLEAEKLIVARSATIVGLTPAGWQALRRYLREKKERKL